MVVNIGGQIEIVNNMYDVADLIQPVFGYDISDFIKSESRQFDKEKYLTDLKFNSDFNAYEASLDSHNTAFIDILDAVEDLMEYLSTAKRLDRDKMFRELNSIKTIINNEV